MAIVQTPHAASHEAKTAIEATQQDLPSYIHRFATDFLLAQRHPPVSAVISLERLRFPILASGYHRYIFALYDPIGGSLRQDICSFGTLVVPAFADYQAILPPISADRRLVDLLLCLPVCILSTIYPAQPANNHRFIPSEYRPGVWVRVLPALENILYGANISNILSAHQSVLLDVLAWIPYGLCHYGAPFVCSAIMFIFGPPGTVPVFAKTFGYISLTAVAIQLVFPCSPPWYENTYGLAPADYSIKGDPAGLARIDALLGIDLYTSGFHASPVVFGAFPSLHAADSTLAALFMSHVFPKLKPLFVTYTLWMWWATMYLSHHYAVDLVSGGILAAVAFYFAKARFLPRVQPGKRFRWDYDYIERGNASDEEGYDMAHFKGHMHADSDEWTVGSSSSVSSGSLSPTEDQHLWEGETLASFSDLEAGRESGREPGR